MKIIIFGVGGFLGKKLYDVLSKNHSVVGTCNKNEAAGMLKIDALDENRLRKFILDNKPDFVVDTIALTSSFLCERNPDLARKLNFQTAKNITDVCREINVPIVFFSSSFVFDGERGNYSEEDAPNPINVYGKTKLEAEKYLLSYSQSVILRVDLLYGYNGKNLSNGILGKIIFGDKMEVGNPSQIRQPLLIDDLPEIILKLVLNKRFGIFHVAGSTKIQNLEFMKRLESLVRSDSKIEIINPKNLIVKPLNDSSLNCSKINFLGIKTKNLDEGLNCLKKFLDH